MATHLACPACGKGPFNTRVDKLDLPYFGDVLQFVFSCEACGFRRADVHIVKEAEPVRYRVAVTSPADLAIRVVRSASGHFEVPELGVRAEPSEAAEAFVSNVEGVLDRCVSAISMARQWAEDDATRAEADERLRKAERLRSLEEPWSVLIEDPFGNSAIVSEKAERVVLSRDEAAALGTPYPIFDMGPVGDASET